MTTSTHKSAKKPAKRIVDRFKLNKQIVKKVAIMIAVVVALLGVYELGRQGGRWGAPDALRLIRSEKIVSKTLLGMKLVSSEETGVNDFTRKTVSPSIENKFEPINDDVDETINEIIEYAKADGWVHDESYTTFWIGRKHPRKDIELVVFIKEYERNIILSVGGRDDY